MVQGGGGGKNRRAVVWGGSKKLEIGKNGLDRNPGKTKQLWVGCSGEGDSNWLGESLATYKGSKERTPCCGKKKREEA